MRSIRPTTESQETLRVFESYLKRGRRKPIAQRDTESCVALDVGVSQIEQMLPHRAPFRFVDQITAADLPNSALFGRHHVPQKAPVFDGHFPNDPVYPGVLLVEAMGQIALCLQHLLRNKVPVVHPTDRPRSLRLIKIENALFQAAVRPGDELELIAVCVEDSDYVASCVGQALVGGQIAALAAFEVLMLEEEQDS